MDTTEMRKAIQQAEQTFRAADCVANDIATVLRGRLQSGGVSDYNLKRLKKELANYNIHTGRWKD